MNWMVLVAAYTLAGGILSEFCFAGGAQPRRTFHVVTEPRRSTDSTQETIQEMGIRARRLLYKAVRSELPWERSAALDEFKKAINSLETEEHDLDFTPALQEILKTLKARLEVNDTETQFRRMSSKEAMEATRFLFEVLNRNLVCEQSTVGESSSCVVLPKELRTQIRELLPLFHRDQYRKLEPGELNHWALVQAEAERTHRLIFGSEDSQVTPTPRPEKIIHALSPAPTASPVAATVTVHAAVAPPLPTIVPSPSPMPSITVNVQGGNAVARLIEVDPKFAARGNVDVAGGNSVMEVRVARGQPVTVYLYGGNTVLEVPYSFRNKGHVYFYKYGGNSEVRYY